MKLFSERGQSIVEFALVLPIILLLVMGSIDFGMLFFTKSQVEAASEAGARTCSLTSAATMQSDGTAKWEQSLTKALDSEFPDLKNLAVQVQLPGTDNNTDNNNTDVQTLPTVSVTAQAQYTFLTPVIEVFFGGQRSISVSSTTTMVQESQ